MLQSYFHRYQSSSTSKTKLLEEKEVILNSLASLHKSIEPPAPICKDEGFVMIDPTMSLSSVQVNKFSGAIFFLSGETILPFTKDISPLTNDITKPLYTFHYFVTQKESSSLKNKQAYTLVQRSFEAYRKQRRLYNLKRLQDAKSFIDDDDE